MAINTINGALVVGIPIANVTGLQAALDTPGNGGLGIGDVGGLQAALDGKADTGDSIPSSQISDSTAAGRAMLTAATAAAQAQLLPVVTRTARGMVPTAPSGTGTAKFLREPLQLVSPDDQVIVKVVDEKRCIFHVSNTKGKELILTSPAVDGSFPVEGIKGLYAGESSSPSRTTANVSNMNIGMC